MVYVAGYTYKAAIYCPSCTLKALPTGEGEEFDGWKDMSQPPMSAEDNLSEIAFTFGINRDDEWTFDSDDFPKVILSTHVEDEECEECWEDL